MKQKTLIAIDPGAAGGLAVQLGDGKAFTIPMPATHEDIVAKLRAVANESTKAGYEVDAFLEQLVKHMGPGIPASTMAVYAGNWGVIKGACLALGFRLQLVRPQEWIATLDLGKCTRIKIAKDCGAFEKADLKRQNGAHKIDWKNKLKSEAQRLFPHLDVTLKTADSLLILEHARRTAYGKLF